MDLMKIKAAIDSATALAEAAADGDVAAVKAFFRDLATVRAIVDTARVRSEDQRFVRELVILRAAQLESKVTS